MTAQLTSVLLPTRSVSPRYLAVLGSTAEAPRPFHCAFLESVFQHEWRADRKVGDVLELVSDHQQGVTAALPASSGKAKTVASASYPSTRRARVSASARPTPGASRASNEPARSAISTWPAERGSSCWPQARARALTDSRTMASKNA